MLWANSPGCLVMVNGWSSAMQDLELRYQEASGLADRSAYKIFYGPVRPAPVLVLGANPGGDPAEVLADGLTRADGQDASASAGYYDQGECDLLDCVWPENTGLKKLLVPLFQGDEQAIRTQVVKTNLAFRRSKRKTGIDFARAKREAAPFLAEILGIVQPRLIILTGSELGAFAETFGHSVLALGDPVRDEKLRHVVFEAVRFTLRCTGGGCVIVRVDHASQFHWTYQRYGVVERIRALVQL